MRAELAAVKALLSPLHTVHEIAATGTLTYPYYLLWSSTGNAPVERSIRAETTDVDDVFGVTTVALNADSVRIAAAQARAAICPNGLPASLTVTGRVVRVVFFEGRPIQADNDVTLTSGAHPLYGVDLYRLVSTPA